jgi:hypothetical protein
MGMGGWASSISMVSDQRLDDRDSTPGREKMVFPLASVFRPALRSTKSPKCSFPGVKHGQVVTPTTHPFLVPRSRMSKSDTSFRLWRPHGGSGISLLFTMGMSIHVPSWVLTCVPVRTPQSGAGFKQRDFRGLFACRATK